MYVVKCNTYLDIYTEYYATEYYATMHRILFIEYYAYDKILSLLSKILSIEF